MGVGWEAPTGKRGLVLEVGVFVFLMALDGLLEAVDALHAGRNAVRISQVDDLAEGCGNDGGSGGVFLSHDGQLGCLADFPLPQVGCGGVSQFSRQQRPIPRSRKSQVEIRARGNPQRSPSIGATPRNGLPRWQKATALWQSSPIREGQPFEGIGLGLRDRFSLLMPVNRLPRC